MKKNTKVFIFNSNISGIRIDVTPHVFIFMFCVMNFAYLTTFFLIRLLGLSSNRASPILKLCRIYDESNSKSASIILNASYTQKRLLAFTSSIETSIEDQIFLNRVRIFLRFVTPIVVIHYILLLSLVSDLLRQWLSLDNQSWQIFLNSVHFLLYLTAEVILLFNPILLNLRFWRKIHRQPWGTQTLKI